MFDHTEGVLEVESLSDSALPEVLDAEAAEKFGAGRYERSEDRVTHRNGTRSKTPSTKAGDRLRSLCHAR